MVYLLSIPYISAFLQMNLKCFLLGTDIVVQWIKPLLTTLMSHVGESVEVLTAPDVAPC